MIKNHKHSWLWWDWEKIRLDDLLGRPIIISGEPIEVRITSPTNWQVLTYNGTGWYWENV